MSNVFGVLTQDNIIILIFKNNVKRPSLFFFLELCPIVLDFGDSMRSLNFLQLHYEVSPFLDFFSATQAQSL